jgi:helix-turn-helix protein
VYNLAQYLVAKAINEHLLSIPHTVKTLEEGLDNTLKKEEEEDNLDENEKRCCSPQPSRNLLVPKRLKTL